MGRLQFTACKHDNIAVLLRGYYPFHSLLFQNSLPIWFHKTNRKKKSLKTLPPSPFSTTPSSLNHTIFSSRIPRLPAGHRKLPPPKNIAATKASNRTPPPKLHIFTPEAGSTALPISNHLGPAAVTPPSFNRNDQSRSPRRLPPFKCRPVTTVSPTDQLHHP